jgi:hypothetical protein
MILATEGTEVTEENLPRPESGLSPTVAAESSIAVWGQGATCMSRIFNL